MKRLKPIKSFKQTRHKVMMWHNKILPVNIIAIVVTLDLFLLPPPNPDVTNFADPDERSPFTGFLLISYWCFIKTEWYMKSYITGGWNNKINDKRG